jgi:Uma2 family endonuclease
LLIDVSDTTVSYDRDVKIPRYARCGIPEAWLVNLPAQCLEMYRHLENGAYTWLDQIHQGLIHPRQLPETVIELGDVFQRP